jgi:hypothetical protein
VRNKTTLKVRRWNTRALRQGKMGLAVIFMETGHRLNVTKVMCL